MSAFERKLQAIRVLFRAPTLALYGIPYDMREGQSPGNLWRGRRRPIVYGQTYGRTEAAPGPQEDWIWLGSPGWYGTMPESEQRAVEAFLAEHKDSVPGGPYEWDRIEGGVDMRGDEDIESDEPEEGDWTTEDHRKFYSYGKLMFVLPEGTGECEMWTAIEAKMKKDGFWPNVWFISDHGNASLMTNPGSKVCRPPRKKKGKKKRGVKLGGLSSEFVRDCAPGGCEVKRR